jgi:hypothetical protein
MPHLKYFKYVVKHKWYVFLAGRALKVPLYRLVFHDWTKFLSREWFPYAEYFYGNNSSEELKHRFDLAWNHHQHKNDHHWQYWILVLDDGGQQILPMSEVARKEMVADWRGAGKAVGKPNTAEWYLKNRENILLHKDTRKWVEEQLGIG